MYNASLVSGSIDQDQVAAFCQLANEPWPLFKDMRMMQFHASYVSTSVDGDYYAAMFAEEDTDDPDSYLIIQRQFENPEDDTCYIESHDRKYGGHFLVRRIEFTPEKLLVEFDRPNDNLISLTFVMAPSKFAEVSRVIKIISGEIEPRATE